MMSVFSRLGGRKEPARTVLSDPTLDLEFRRKGYVVYPLLNPDQVESLLELHAASTPEVPADYYATPFSQDPEYRWRLYKGITGVMQDQLSRLLPEYQTVIGGFVTKRANTTQGKVPIHQDYSFVDNQKHVSVHVWCSLVDTNERNGCIKVVKGSHSFFKHISAIPPNPSPFGPISEQLEREFTTRLPMKAGEALIYDERLLHASDDNLSDSLRIAGGCALVPAAVSPRLYCYDKRRPDRLDVLEVDEAFLGRFEPAGYIGEPYPVGVRRIGSVSYTTPTVRSLDLERLRVLQADLAQVPV